MLDVNTTLPPTLACNPFALADSGVGHPKAALLGRVGRLEGLVRHPRLAVLVLVIPPLLYM